MTALFHRTFGASDTTGKLRALRVEESFGPSPQVAVRSDASVFPCSFAQQRLWFLDRMAPGSPFYNVSIPVPVLAAVNHGLLQRALNTLVQRHETLRTTFSVVDGEPCQIVHAILAFGVESVDLRHLATEAREQRTIEIVSREAERTFDLERGPLIRCTLVRRGTLDHILILTLHHIVCDGWSLGILGRELTTLYQAFSQGRPDPLPELPIQYVDYAVWQRERVTGAVLDEQLAFWKNKLSGLQTLDLPTDRPRPPILSFAGALHAVRLPPALTVRVRAAAQQFGVTPYMLMLSAFAALLHRYSGQTDIAIGAPLAGRPEPETELLVGFFVNSVLLRIDVAGSPNFAELVARVRETALDAFTHQDLPFEKLVEEIRPPRDPSRNPMFQVSFQLVNLPGLQARAGSPATPPIEALHRTAIFDLAFTLIDAPAAFSGVIEYSTDLFDASTIEALDRHFQCLLDGALAAPATPVARLSLSDASEQKLLLAAAGGPNLDVPPALVFEAIERQAQRAPDAVAIESDDGGQLSYRDLRTRWRCIAGRLAELDVGPETRVGVCMDRCPDAVAALLAVWATGGVYVPLDPGYPHERLRFMMHDAKIEVVLTHAKHVRPDGALEGCTARPVLLDPEEAALLAAPRHWEPRAIHPDNLAYVIYTSGSTGRPKAVGISHRATANHMYWMLDAFPVSEDDRVLQRTAASFDASVWEFIIPLMSGARLVLLAPDADRSAHAIVRTIIRARVTVLQVVPALLRLLVEEAEISACTSLRRVFCGGERLSEDVCTRILGALAVELVNLYGPTEATIDATAFICDNQPAPLGVPIGRTIANTCAYVLDPLFQLTPAGLEGELYLGGPNLARGYLDRPGMTAERFVPDPFATSPGARLYRTGDRVRLRPDRNIVFVGRSDRQLKIRGYRIEPGEIETVIRHIAGVKDCAVIADQAGISLAAFLVPTAAMDTAQQQLCRRTDADPRAGTDQGLVAQVRLQLGSQLPEYMVPSRFVLVDALPLSANGKLDVAALQPQLSQRPAIEGSYVPPRTPVEEALVLIWAQTLGLERVGIRDGFFSELGGHSLLATQVIARVRDALRVEAPLKLIFVAQTIEGFAATLLECPPPQRRILEKAAELYVKLSRMSEEELDLALAEPSLAEF
jgi:amino acid adenylation domain-containing protein